MISLLKYTCKIVYSWARCIRLLSRNRDIVHISIGQTWASVVRDYIPVYIATCLTKSRTIISLHGNNFTIWKNRSALRYVFLMLIKRGSIVSVLSRRQKDILVEMGIDTRKLRIVHNATIAPGLTDTEIRAKQEDIKNIKLLHLSSLIDSKGYPQYIESLKFIAESKDRIQAILCGRFVKSQFADRFQSEAESSSWIEARITELANLGINLSWIKGAYGDSKWELYRESHIFVFPSQYLVEAQPIVLLEAMAMGSVIITTKVGEINEILSDIECVYINDASPETIAEAISNIITNSTIRVNYAMAANKCYNQRHSLDKYISTWVDMYKECEKISAK